MKEDVNYKILFTQFTLHSLVNESFHTMIGQLIFTFAVLFLGILIPLIIYFATMYKKQKFVRTTVSDFITKEFVNNNKAVNV